MRYHSQNLTDGKVSKFWRGRAWLHLNDNHNGSCIHWEWLFGRMARNASIMVSFGSGDSDREILLHLCIPFLFSLFLGFDSPIRCKECACGVTIHDQSIWFYPLAYRMDSPDKTDPWYRHVYSWHFPWSLHWHSTEICEHQPNDSELKSVWSETTKNRKRFLDSYEERKRVEASVSRDYKYAYILKNRSIQSRTATVHVSRMTHRARWWPIIPIQKTRTYIDVSFDQEVGEETGSWKGGCIGCSYEMKWGESPERCLSRMEHEREFRRH